MYLFMTNLRDIWEVIVGCTVSTEYLCMKCLFIDDGYVEWNSIYKVIYSV